jgi:glycosyltransferase involved in cell wall biosynthesis
MPISKENARKAIGWSMEDRVVLFNHGNNPVEKGFHIAEEAVRIAKASIGDIRFVVLDGSVSPDDMPLYLNASDCLLVASDWEGSPNIVKEAMACNLPVVSSRVGDIEERFSGVYPFKVTDRQADRLGEALAEVLTLNCRSNGREKVIELSQGNIMKRLIALYMEVFDKIYCSRVG